MNSKLISKIGVVAGLGFGLALAAGTTGAEAATSPVISVMPSTGLVDGQSMTVSGTGLAVGGVYHIGECVAVSPTSYACGPNVNVTADANGSASTPYTALKTFTATAKDGTTTAADCTKVQCVIAFYNDAFSGGSVNLSFV